MNNLPTFTLLLSAAVMLAGCGDSPSESSDDKKSSASSTATASQDGEESGEDSRTENTSSKFPDWTASPPASTNDCFVCNDVMPSFDECVPDCSEQDEGFTEMKECYSECYAAYQENGGVLPDHLKAEYERVIPPPDPVLTNSVGMDMMRVDQGTFTMGCIHGTHNYAWDGCPNTTADFGQDRAHQVTISQPFLMAATEVTQEQFKTVTGYVTRERGWEYCASCPVERVTWYEALLYANALSEKEGLTPCYALTDVKTAAERRTWKATVQWDRGATCTGYRLPTEAEWELAARAGTSDWYSGGNDMKDIGWFRSNSDDRPKPVGTKKPNALGIHDMSGNVQEWVWDYYARDYHLSGGTTDPRGPDTADRHIAKGGHYDDPCYGHRGGQSPPIYCGTAVSYRKSESSGTRRYDTGFRLVRAVP